MPDTDRLALADELERIAAYYHGATKDGDIMREAAAALRAMPTPAGEDAPSDAEVAGAVDAICEATTRESGIVWKDDRHGDWAYMGPSRHNIDESIRFILTSAYKVRQQALSATPGPASREQRRIANCVECGNAILEDDDRWNYVDVEDGAKAHRDCLHIREPASREETK